MLNIMRHSSTPASGRGPAGPVWTHPAPITPPRSMKPLRGASLAPATFHRINYNPENSPLSPASARSSSSYADPELDVIDSPSLPVNVSLALKLKEAEEGRRRNLIFNTDQDPFFESNDDEYESDDSDATVTPTSYAAHRHHSRQKLALTSDTTENMAPAHVAKNGAMDSRAAPAGPPLGTIKVGHQYICECHIRRMFTEKRLDAAREANYRLQGIQMIETVREALLLPVKTYNTACTFYHRFRLEHPAPDYNYTEAAVASLFVACKVEDTLKKSREILCAHHNFKNPDHLVTPDDKMFDQPSKVVIGIERYMVEAIGFDFRVRFPQKILVKIIKKVLGPSTDIKHFFPTALKMSIDLYKTYAPLKHGSYTCAIVVAQLTALVTGHFLDKFGNLDPLDWHSDEQCVAEVMLDLLDLYTQHGKATKVGPMFDLQVFIDIQIKINQYVEHAQLSRYMNQCRECQNTIPPPTPSTGSPMSLSTPSAAGTSTIKRGPRGPEGATTRFLFDAEEAAREQRTYDEYTKDEWEEYEEEVEELIPDPREERRHEPRGPRGPRGHGHGHGRGHGRGGFDPGWTPRNRHDRRRRGGGFY
ncbi:hypothetical protein F5Y06DRAFT_203189 [Hypoxylon sp. FL0890]|nr:hypothetical protein F5Y06DRAFT_203189 [Hypoxylon sp. FL0890]